MAGTKTPDPNFATLAGTDADHTGHGGKILLLLI